MILILISSCCLGVMALASFATGRVEGEQAGRRGHGVLNRESGGRCAQPAAGGAGCEGGAEEERDSYYYYY